MTITTVTTNLDDYAPGSTAYITAAGFEEGATITFKVVHVSGAGPDGILGTLDDVEEDLGGEGHEAWTVMDGSAEDLDGMVNGSVLTTWYVNPDDSLYATFLLTAKDADGLVASNTFTDADGAVNKVYQHWADGDTQSADWNNNILSDGKSNYFEGEVVPHVFIYTASRSAPLITGETYSFVITYDYYQQNSKAGGFAYVTTYNTDRQPVALNATDPYIAPSQDDAFANQGGMQGSFYTVDANITAVSDAVTSGSGNVQRNVTVTFEYTGASTNNDIAEIYYGLHIAEPGNVNGSTYGAKAWTGGSLQTTVTVGGSGATSIQLAPSAIIVGSISGYKFGDLNGNGAWDTGEVGLAGWTIYLDADNDGTLDLGELSTVTDQNGLYSFSVTPEVTSYFLRELNQVGWTQTTANPAPIIISAADPTEANVNFGNQLVTADYTITKTAMVDDGVADNAGDLITYTITVTNTGNVTVTGVMVNDPMLADLVQSGGDVNEDGRLDVDESWTYTGSYELKQSDLDTNGGGDAYLDNTASVVSNELAVEKTASAAVPLVLPTIIDGLIAPTSTTVQQYISGTASTFQDYYASQNGVIQYGVKSNKISQVNPGVFFYFTGLSEGLKADADGDGDVDPLKITVDQTVTGMTPFSTTVRDVKLYKITDVNQNGLIDSGDGATQISLSRDAVTFGIGTTAGDVTVDYTPPTDDVSALYVLSIKYSAASVIGASVGMSRPTVEYEFQTLNGATPLATETGSITLASKPNAMTLEGDLGDGAQAIKQPQLSHVFDAAVKYWAENGVEGADLEVIKNAQIKIAALEGYWLGEADSETGTITIDDDAGGHGWSIGLGNVAPNKVDLLSVLVHEMAHLLGVDDQDLTAELAIGERVMPMASNDAPAFVPLGLVGASAELPAQAHFA